MNDILFIGGDRRSVHAAQILSQYAEVGAAGLDGGLLPPERKYSAIVLPLPFSRDGRTINAPLCDEPLPLRSFAEFAAEGAVVLSGGSSTLLREICSENGFELCDYSACEELVLKNALLTAEAAVSLLIGESERALSGSEVVVTGYGRIARYLVRMLSAFNANVTVIARDPVQRQAALLDGCVALPTELFALAAGGADFIVNTVPAQLLCDGGFEGMRSGAVYLELATRSSRPEKEYSERAGVRYVNGSGLPGKLSPKTAGEEIANIIMAIMAKINS